MKKIMITSLFILLMIIPNISAEAKTFHGVDIEQRQIIKKTGFVVMHYNLAYSPIFNEESECQNYLQQNYNSSSNYTCTKVDYDDGGDGLYEDEYTSGRYVYRGANPNNYIKFNDELWRIISYESDGKIKILRNEVLSEKIPYDKPGERTTGYCSYGDVAKFGCNVWAATSNMVGTPLEFINDTGKYLGVIKGAVDKDSTLNIYLNDEYYNKLTSDSQKLIVNHDFGIGPNGGLRNLVTLPETLENEQSYKWNGKIALANESDYHLANSNQIMCNNGSLIDDNMDACVSTNWMFTDKTPWFILTTSQSGPATVWSIWDDGVVSWASPNQLLGIRPALYLNSNVYLKGNGTIENPFEITNKPDNIPNENKNNYPQVVEVPATSAYASVIIIVLGILCIIISVIVTKKLTNKN